MAGKRMFDAHLPLFPLMAARSVYAIVLQRFFHSLRLVS